jgi:predicted ATPase
VLALAAMTRDDGRVGVQGRWLVGHGPELVEVAELVADAAARRGRVALISGEAGIGKTSLAETVDATAREAGFDVAWARCSSAEMLSFWPWTQVLNALLGTAELLEPTRFASRQELFAAVAEAVEACTRVQPVLVIFEDAHWADPGSLGLLEFLGGMAVGQRLALVITSRDAGILAGIPGIPGLRRLELSGLDPAATAALVRRIVTVEPSEEYLAEVHRRSGGNPFFATEVARLQASRGTPTGAIPVGVRQVLEHRLARLPQESVELLQVASVIGAPDLGRLASVTGRPESEVAALLEEPVAAGVVVAGEFAHELMREALYQGMSAARCAALHRQAAENLQAESPAVLARHWLLASGADARLRAAQLAVVAGDLAVAGLAHEQAVGHYRMACELGIAADLTVRRRLAAAQVMAGQIGGGRDTLRAVARQARAAGFAEELAWAVLAMGGGSVASRWTCSMPSSPDC